ncbi:hypothetical protein HDV00_009134 [Rhizophlyctis rosea]|nr:hypothetical protein HDV00_009134 [Rhizophlyctis rosea]
MSSPSGRKNPQTETIMKQPASAQTSNHRPHHIKAFTALPWKSSVLLALLRLGLFVATDVPTILANRVEASTPVTSFKRLQEGLYLFQHGIPPYDGSIYHQAPLLLPLFHFIPSRLHPLVFILLDLAIAHFLILIAEYKQQRDAAEVWPKPRMVEDKDEVTGEVKGEKKKDVDTRDPQPVLIAKEVIDPSGPDVTRPDDSDIRLHPQTIGIIYLLNPYTIITCLAKSTQPFSTLASVMTIYYATREKKAPAMLCLAIAMYLSFYPIVLLAPVVLLLAERRELSISKTFASSLSFFSLYLSGLLGVSCLLVGSWQFLSSTYGAILFVPDLTPNVGLFWYFFIEMFDHYRTFFLCVFQIFVFIFVVPVSVKFRDHPLFVALVVTAIVTIFKSYPSVADIALSISFFSMHSELFKYMRNVYLSTNGLIYASVLGPLFHNLWLYAGSGNANFFFAITLVWAMAQVFGVLDVTFAMMRREWDRKNAGLRVARVEVVHK